MRRPTQPGLEVVTWPVFAGYAVDALVTTRGGGVSEGSYASLNLGLHVGDDPDRVVENRRRAAATLALDLADLVFCTQAHGRKVALVGEADRGRGAWSLDDAVADVDALVTATPGLGLVAMVADCVPIVLYEPAAQVVACVHAGWRGTFAQVIDATLDAMATLGGQADRIVAGIGPAVSVDRYQVGDEVAAAARACFPSGVEDVLRPDGDGRWRVDLQAANRRILIEAGVVATNIDVMTSGTGRGTAYFSDRQARPCGRFAVLATLRP